MKIAIDFDGVICQHKTIPSEKEIDNLDPIYQSFEAIKWLQNKHELYVLTNRNNDEVVKWLDKNDFKNLLVTDRKLPDTKMYIDDRAVRFTNWQDICKFL